MPKRENNFFIQEFILGGWILYHSFTLGQQACPLKKMPFLGNSLKVSIFIGCQKLSYCPTPSSFLFFLQFFSLSHHSIFFKDKILFRVHVIVPTFKTDFRRWYFSRTFKNGEKCSGFETFKFFQGLVEAQSV